MNYIFSYGTLKDMFQNNSEEVEILIPYRMGNYGQYKALIKDNKEHKIKGFILSLSDEEFKKADEWEGYPDLYDRELIKIKNQEVYIYFLK